MHRQELQWHLPPYIVHRPCSLQGGQQRVDSVAYGKPKKKKRRVVFEQEIIEEDIYSIDTHIVKVYEKAPSLRDKKKKS